MTTKKETIQETITRINQEIGSNKKSVQEFILLEEPERQLLVEIKRRLGLGKPRGIAVACKYLLEQLDKEPKTDVAE